MKRNIYTLLIVSVIWLIAGSLQHASAQGIRIKATHYGDKFVNKGDTVDLVLTGSRGELQWQKSTDGYAWEDISGATGMQLTTKIDTSLYFRVRMKEPECDEAYSDEMPVVPVMIDENAVVLDPESTSLNSDSTELSQGIYRLGTSAELDIQPGEVLVGQDGNGYIRKVESAEKVGDEWIVTTTQGTLEDVIDEISLKDYTVISLDGSVPKMGNLMGRDVPARIVFTAPGLSLKTGLNGIQLGPLTLIDETSGEDHFQATLKPGTLVFNPVLRRELDITETNGIEHFLFSVDGSLDMTAQVEITGTAAFDRQIDPVTLFTAEVGPLTIGPVPMYVHVSFVLDFETQMNADGTVLIGCISGYQTEFGASYNRTASPAWSTVWTHTLDSESDRPQVDMQANANARLSVTPSFDLTIAGVAGPGLEVEPYVRGTVEADAESCHAIVYAGIDSYMTFDVSALGYGIQSDPFDLPQVEWKIYEGSGSVKAPTVTTTDPYAVSDLDGYSGGEVTDDGGSEVTSRGICWNTAGSPGFGDQFKSEGSGIGAFAVQMTGLAPETTYYVRAFAINEEDTAFGAEKEFRTEEASGADGQFTDVRDGHVYKYKTIGTQTWMIENLAWLPVVNQPHYRFWPYDYRGPRYYVNGYDNYDEVVEDAKALPNYKTYGALYNFEAAQGACPAGWHLPSDEEWKELERYLGMNEHDVNSIGSRASGDVPMKLKSTSGWEYGGRGINGDNSSGFNARPGGYRHNDGFSAAGYGAWFWTSDYYAWVEGSSSYSRSISADRNDVWRPKSWGYEGYSVRCIKGEQKAKPVVRTLQPEDIRSSTAIAKGEVDDPSGTGILARGFCWATGYPNFYNSRAEHAVGTGSFSDLMYNLIPNTTYYLKAYAVNIAGGIYGDMIEFTTGNIPGEDGVFTDTRDGKTYRYKDIGSQKWMMDNLAYLPKVNSPTDGSSDAERYYVYGYTGTDEAQARATANYNTYGVLYNKAASENACPEGWHLPTDAEWSGLTEYLVNNGYGYGGSGDDIAKSLASTTGWLGSGIFGTIGNGAYSNNSSGFSAMPGGNRNVILGFRDLTSSAGFLTSSDDALGRAYMYTMVYSSDVVTRTSAEPASGNSIRCIKGESAKFLPTVATAEVTGVSTEEAYCGGNVTADGGAEVTARGVCWNTTGDPVIGDDHTTNGSGTGEFSSYLSGLSENTTYYVRAYATNSVGTAYGEQREFTTENGDVEPDGSFTDSRDGKTYNYKIIGSQTWMMENLAWLPSVNTSIDGSTDVPKYYVSGYNGTNVNDAAASGNYTTYGVLYNWSAAKEACPDGWHLPTDEEYTALTGYLADNGYGWEGSGPDIAKSMAARSGWVESATAGQVGNNQTINNTSGFGALPGGLREQTGSFSPTGQSGEYWTASEGSGSMAWLRILNYNSANVIRINMNSDFGLSVRCLQGEAPKDPPTVTTSEVSEISTDGAVCGGNVTDDGGADVTARGVCWNTGGNPVASDDHTVDGAGTGTFTSNLTGLSENTTYYVRAYATNSEGTAYGEERELTTEEGGGVDPDGSFTDSRDGKSYNYKIIGSQTWMMENLAYLPSVSPSTQGGLLDPYYYVYDYEGTDASAAKSTDNYATYGALYNRAAAVNACPSGWHLPTDEELTALTDYLTTNGYGFEGSGDDIAKSMASTSLWLNDDTPGNIGNDQASNNSSGFSARPAGYRTAGSGGAMSALGFNTTLWSSSPAENSRMWCRLLYSSLGVVNRGNYSSQNAFSVRCLQGSKPATMAFVTTDGITDITESTAACIGTVADDGGATVTERGICWNTGGTPTVSDNKQVQGSGTGTFTVNLTGLSPNTLYFARAYAVNSLGTNYGLTLEFTTDAGGGVDPDGSFTDSRDGKTYNYKIIGSQTWMMENLAYLPSVSPSSDGSVTSAYYYVYDYEGSDVGEAKAQGNYSTYGALYNWQAATTACPDGWHLPTSDEYSTLESYLTDNGFGFEGSGDDIGKALAATSGWSVSSTPGAVGYDQGTNNASGFSAMGAGLRPDTGGFIVMYANTAFWTATEGGSSETAIERGLYFDGSRLGNNDSPRGGGFSVRCVKN